MSPRVGLSMLFVLGCAACTALVGLDGAYEAAPAETSPDGSVVDDAAALADAAPEVASDARGDAPDASTPPVLISLDGGFAVGAIEVTQREYAAWLSTSPSVEHQSSTCAWNTTFVPDSACLQRACTGLGCDAHPQACIDWCDAFAFCEAMGQRLCGQIGGGSEAFSDFANADRSQWFAACSVGGSRIYPYGNGYHVGYCNGGDNQQTGCIDGGSCQTVIAGASLRCFADAPEGAKLFDMSGNVSEWTDACSGTDAGGPALVACRIRGGSYTTTGDQRVRCAGDDVIDVAPRATVAADVGARCCSR